jgi:hypothetical protein
MTRIGRSRRASAAFTIALCAAVAAVELGCNATCDERALPGIVVNVGSSFVCDGELTVTIDDGAYHETLRRSVESSICQFNGAIERPGMYLVTVTRADQSTAATVQIGADSCHVLTKTISIGS